MPCHGIGLIRQTKAHSDSYYQLFSSIFKIQLSHAWLWTVPSPVYISGPTVIGYSIHY